MSRDIIVVGVNYRTAPVEIRERLAFAEPQLGSALSALKAHAQLEECLILSTCNRVEVYGVTPAVDGAGSRLAEFLGRHSALERSVLEPALYTHWQPTSVQHLFRVASGLESMVLGESEITGQVKSAYATALQHGATGKVFNVLFQKALNAAKDVRSHTGLGRGAVSVGSVSVDLAQKIFGQLAPRRILLIGAGEIAELVLKHLTARGAQHVTVANRTLEQAVLLAERYHGHATSLEHPEVELAEADIAIVATAAPTHLLTVESTAHLMRQRRHRPLLLIDLAVPRNVDPSVSRLEDVYLYNIDDLQNVVAGHRQAREQAVEQSREIIERKSHLFMEWLADAHAIPVPAGHARKRLSPMAG